MTCFPSPAQPFDDVRKLFDSGDVVLFDNDACTVGACCCCCCCVLVCARALRGIDVHNACCARSWRRAALVLVDSANQVYAFEFSCPPLADTPSNRPDPATPRDALSGRVQDVGFRLVPLSYLLERAAVRGAYVHALRKLYVADQRFHTALGGLLQRQMLQLQADAASITALQVETLCKQGGIVTVSGTVADADRRLFAAADSGYLVFFLLRQLGLAKATKAEKYYDVEDVLRGGAIDASLVGARLGDEIGFYYSPMKPPDALLMA